MEPRFFRTAAWLAAGGLAACIPAFAAGLHTGAASASASGAPAQFSTTIGVSTPGKRIIGTSRDTGPQAAAASDQRLLNQVVAALVRDPAMQGADIDVSVQEGQVTLDGKAKDSSQADHAKQVAENIAGSGKVTSQLSTSG
jgi:hypothetical protein